MRERARREDSITRVRVHMASHILTLAKCTISYKVIHPLVSSRTMMIYLYLYAQNHAFARYVLPVAESEIKEQDWPDKQNGAEDQTESNVDKEGSDRTRDDDDSEEESQGPNMTDEQRMFLDQLLEEMQTVESFKNNPAESKDDLKLLDGSALQQLESRLSIDDQ